MFALFNMLEDVATATTSDTSAIQQILDNIKLILNTPLVVIGGTTITGGLVVALVVRCLYKYITGKDVTINEIVNENSELAKENEQLKAQAQEQEERIAVLEAKMDVVTENTPNQRVRNAKQITSESLEVKKKEYVATTSKEALKKKIKVRIKKAVEEGATNGN